MIKMRPALSRLTVVAAFCTALFGAAATAAHADDPIDGAHADTNTYVAFAGCNGVVWDGQRRSDGSHFARATFSLGTSSRGKSCMGWMERSTDNGKSWALVSGYHFDGDNATGWYYNGGSYLARACVGDFLYANSYSCGHGR